MNKARCRETVDCFVGIKNLSLFYLVPSSIMSDVITISVIREGSAFLASELVLKLKP